MLNFENRIDSFSPVKWESGKNSEERFHFLGRLVEPYFDIGQQSYVVHHNPTEEGIPVYTDTRKRSWVKIAMKVVTVFLKVVSYFTLVIPFFMLLGKAIYRSSNNFVLQDRIDPKEHERLVKQLCQRYSSVKEGNHYHRLSSAIDEFALGTCDTPGDLDFIDATYREINMVKGEIQRLRALKRVDESDKVYGELDDIEADLDALLETFDASISGDVHKGQMLEALEASYQAAYADLERFAGEYHKWKEVQDEVLDDVDPEVFALAEPRGLMDRILLEKFDALLEKSLNADVLKDYSLGTYQALDKFLKHHDLCKRVLPDFESEQKYDVSIEWAQNVLKPVGIRNLGNTCYMNSLLQAIANEPALIESINRNLDIESANRIVHTLKVFVSAHRSANKIAIRTAAIGVRELLLELGIIQHRRQQNDSSEVLQVLQMLSQYPTFNTTIARSYKEGDETKVRETLGHANSLQVSIKNSGLIESDFLQGLIDKSFTKKKMTDRDGWRVRDRVEANEDLGIPEQTELVVNEFEEQSFFDEAPNSLTISLNRFEHEGNSTYKVKQQIKMPVNGIVDLSCAFKDGVVPDGGSPLYEVTSVIRHHGGYGGGHYTGSVQKGTDWTRVNDSGVTPNDPYPGHDGYVYFLRRITA